MLTTEADFSCRGQLHASCSAIRGNKLLLLEQHTCMFACATMPSMEASMCLDVERACFGLIVCQHTLDGPCDERASHSDVRINNAMLKVAAVHSG